MNENTIKPSVFPTKEQTDAAKIAAYEAEKAKVVAEIFNSQLLSDTPQTHATAVDMMRQRTANQLEELKRNGKVQDPSLAEKTSTMIADEQRNQRTEEQIKLRDEQLRKNSSQIQNYQIQANAASERNNNNKTNQLYPQQMETNNNNYQNNYVPPANPPQQPPINNNNGYGENYGKNPSNINPYISEISQPNYNAPYDVIPLPSEGKLYRNKRANVKIAYMTTADENILTSPNLLQSGEFLEILINRKLLEPDLRYKDLHVGDRNAIMLWLRATGYGEMYPVTILDGNNIPFDTEVNLNELKTIKLGAEPDAEGLFDFNLPLTRANIKFRMLNCGDIDEIEKMVEKDKVNNLPIDNTSTYTLERMIVEVNGDRNRAMIKNFVNEIRLPDGKKLNQYVDKINSGIDLDIVVGTPGGGSVSTFLPLNINFFWPNVKL
jgi:hypothetical protein